MTEPVAKILAQEFSSPKKLEAKLVELARKPVTERAFSKYYASPGSAKDGGEHSLKEYSGYIRKSENAQMTPTSPWQDSPKKEQLTIAVMKPGWTDFVITGDAARNKIMTMPTGKNKSATIKIDLPSDWDKLMTGLGYEPLKNFYLK